MERIIFLNTQAELYDILAGCSGQIGVVFMPVVLITGTVQLEMVLQSQEIQ